MASAVNLPFIARRGLLPAEEPRGAMGSTGTMTVPG
jgi:hypothetical protein